MSTPRNILVATDFSEPARKALDYGRELAHSVGATLHILHVVQMAPPFDGDEVDLVADDLPPPIDATVQRSLDAAIGAHAGLAVRAATTTAWNVAEAIDEYATAHDVDLIVAGASRRNFVSRLIRGSVATRLVRSAACPVLTIRS